MTAWYERWNKWRRGWIKLLKKDAPRSILCAHHSRKRTTWPKRFGGRSTNVAFRVAPKYHFPSTEMQGKCIRLFEMKSTVLVTRRSETRLRTPALTVWR